MKKDLSLKTKTDLPATMALIIMLWLCSLILVGLVVAPQLGRWRGLWRLHCCW